MSTPRRKILFLSPNWPGDKAFGGQMRALHTARALRKLGEVSITVVSSDTDYEESMRRSAIEGDLKPPVITVNSHHRTFVDKFRRALDTRYLNVHGCIASPADRARVLSYLSEYDLVWIMNSRLPNILQIWDWPHTHLDVDDIPSAYFGAATRTGGTAAQRWKARVQQALFKRRERRLAHRFTTLSVCSEADRQYLGEPTRVHVIPNGFQRPAVEPQRNPARPARIGFIGLYSYPPNSDGVKWFLAHCWAQVRAAVPGVSLRLIGKDTDGPMRPADPGVEALGWVNDPAEEIASWSAMIVPIRLGGGTRIKIAEAFSRKCPLVSTSFGAFGYEVQHGRQLLLADSPADFAQACIRLIQDPVTGNRMADTAWQEFLSKWTWDAISPKIWAAAEDCLRRTESSRSAGASR